LNSFIVLSSGGQNELEMQISECSSLDVLPQKRQKVRVRTESGRDDIPRLGSKDHVGSRHMFAGELTLGFLTASSPASMNTRNIF
jgi:hypothetical protein